jgi:superfamily I DNA/RNA helicase
MPIFNEDGSLKAPARKHRDHLPALRAIEEVPFGMGQKLLIEHLRGVRNAKTAKLRLDRYLTNGELGGYQEEELKKLLHVLERKGFLDIQVEKGLYPIYVLTQQGRDELSNPTMELAINGLADPDEERLLMGNPFTAPTTLTDPERSLCTALHDFFPHFNEGQRKAVISSSKKILCVAGAGSGKTSVLTSRIAFLVRYRSVPPERILAITFTRKARHEMEERLKRILPGQPITVETFNSFCEKVLQRHGDEALYEQETRMAGPREQIHLLIETLKRHDHTQGSITDLYFTKRQLHAKDPKTLFFSFAYDFHSLVDKLRLTNTTTKALRSQIRNDGEHARLATLLLEMADTYLSLMRQEGLRDYTDQLLDAIALFRKHPELIPSFQHVLVDEYQDVNDAQVTLLDLLAPDSLFAVGDPRQSIYGWRGSKVEHILDLPRKGAEVIALTTNYRSAKRIVDLCNGVAKKTGYHDLSSAREHEGVVTLRSFPSEEEQAAAIASEAARYQGDRKDIFVLARTHKALEKVQEAFDAKGLQYLLRTDELKRMGQEPQSGQATLATVHAIKGMEAPLVYLVAANAANFPCKASDHPVMELYNIEEGYDGYAEELRVLYVALSRAKDELHISYTGTLTPFIPEETVKVFRAAKPTVPAKKAAGQSAALLALRQWRYQKAKEKGVPAYVICSDATLEALLLHRPATTEALQGITGLGPTRIQDYGEEMIDLLTTL